jgi:hypothetical protein
MRALPVVLLLAAAAPAVADTPPPQAPAPAAAADPGEVEDTTVPAPAEPPAETPNEPPIVPPSVARPLVEVPAEPLAAAAPEPPPRRVDYRLQIVAGDAVTVGLSLVVDRLSGDGAGRSGALATLTIGSYFFTAPLIHGLHREGKRALASFGLRAGLPLLFGLVGEQLDGTPPCDFCEDTLRSRGKIVGMTAGVLLAMAIDDVLLARPIYRRAERPRAAWGPALRGVRGGATAGVVGTF